MVIENKDKILRLSDELIAKDTIDFPDIKKILGPSTHDLASIQGFLDLKKEIEAKPLIKS
jgi:hypothetical protein